MKFQILTFCLSMAFASGTAHAEGFKQTIDNWTITSIENRGQGPKMRCTATVTGNPEATGSDFRRFTFSDFYQKKGDGSLTERAAISVILGPGALGDEKASLGEVEVVTPPGEWSSKARANWFPRAKNGTLAVTVIAPMNETLANLAKWDVFSIRIPAGAANSQPVTVDIPMNGSAAARKIFELCRKSV